MEIEECHINVQKQPHRPEIHSRIIKVAGSRGFRGMIALKEIS